MHQPFSRIYRLAQGQAKDTKVGIDKDDQKLIGRKQEKNIAIVSPLFSDPGKHGGITPVVLNLAGGVADQGIGVDLLVRRHNRVATLPTNLRDRVNIVPITAKSRFSTAVSLARYMKYRAPEALLAAGHRFNLAASWARKMAPGCRVFLSVHNTMSTEASYKGRFHSAKRMRSIGTFYVWADGIVAVSRGVADDLLSNTRIPESLVRVIHNPIVTPELVKRSKESVDHPWLAFDGPPVIISVGRLSSQKAFHFLIEAFSTIRNVMDCRLIILGEGNERERLLGLINKLGLKHAVDMPGFMDNPHSWMAKASVFVLSSLYEGFGNVLVEALAVGTPVVSTDCPSGPREILDNGRYGKLVPPADPDALAKGVLDVLEGNFQQFRAEVAVAPYWYDTVARQYLEYMGLDNGIGIYE